MKDRRIQSGRWISYQITVSVVVAMCCIVSFGRSRCERWVQTGGPYGGAFDVLAIDPVTPSTLYASRWGGQIKSTDGGRSWATMKWSTGRRNEGANSIVIDPGTPSIVYLTASDWAYRSTDGGATWVTIDKSLPGTFISNIAVHPVVTSTLYAGTRSGVYRSTDRGENWAPVNKGLTDLEVQVVALDPVTPSTIYAGTYSGSVFRSIDSGANWTLTSSGLPAAAISCLVVDPKTPSVVYAATSGGGIYRTTTGGAHWTPVNNGLENWNIYTLAIDQSAPATLYAATYTGVFVTRDSGANWMEANRGLTNRNTRVVAVDPLEGSILYAATHGGGLFKSTDKGANWVPLQIATQVIFALQTDPQDPTTLYVGTEGDGVHRSTDGGRNWRAMNQGLTISDVYTLAVDPDNPSHVYAGGLNGVFRSTDRAGTWNAINKGLGYPWVHSLAFDRLSSALYIGTAGYVYRTTDRGENWVQVGSRLPALVTSLAIDPANSSNLYASVYEQGVYRSTDGGAHWAAVNDGLTDMDVRCLVINPATPSTLFAGTIGGGVCRSTDKGETWTAVNNGLTPWVQSFAVDSANPWTLYAGGLGDVYRTSDQGEHWTRVGWNNLTAGTFSLAVGVNGTVYAGSGGSSVFRLESDCTLQFSQFGKGRGFTSDLVLTNPSSTKSVTGSVSAADDSGRLLSVGFQNLIGNDFSIPPLAALTLTTDGLGNLTVGSAVAAGSGPLGGIVRFSIPGVGIAGVPSSDTLPAFILPVRSSVGGIRTGLALSNPDLEPVTLDLTLMSQQGNQISGGRRTLEVSGGGHFSQFVDELFPEASINDFHGTLTVEARDGRISGTALELGSQPGQFTTLPVTALAAPALPADFSFAQFGNGLGFTSETVLVNPRSDRTVSGEIKFYDEQGRGLLLHLGGPLGRTSQTFSIPPRGLMRIPTDGLGELKVGSAKVTADGPVGGVVRFQIPGMGTAGVAGNQSMSRFLIPVRRTAAGLRTGIAFQNPTASPVTIALTLRDLTGTAIAATNVENLGAQCHLAKFLEELFPAIEDEFQGTISVEVTGGTVAAAAMELGSQPGEFTTLPVTPLQ